MHEKSIELLNKAVADELSATHQYMYFHFHCEDQGYELLAGLFIKTAIEEMGHIERCAERILFLEGLPNLQDLGKLLIGEDVPEIVKGDLDMLMALRSNMVETMKICEDARDYISRDMLEHMLEEIEEQIREN
mgnify:CR=1 FL=1